MADNATRTFGKSEHGLPVEQALLLEQACDRFEAKWRAGERPDLAVAIRDLPEAIRPAARIRRDRGVLPQSLGRKSGSLRLSLSRSRVARRVDGHLRPSYRTRLRSPAGDVLYNCPEYTLHPAFGGSTCFQVTPRVSTRIGSQPPN